MGVGIAGGEKHLAGGPGQFIVIGKIVAVSCYFLVSAVLQYLVAGVHAIAMLGNGVGEEFPAQLGFLQIESGGGRVSLF
jgi:hypothetical protein